MDFNLLRGIERVLGVEIFRPLGSPVILFLVLSLFVALQCWRNANLLQSIHDANNYQPEIESLRFKAVLFILAGFFMWIAS
jgi:hypothetical protein